MHLAKSFTGGKRLVVGIGSALVDVLAREDDAFLDRLGGAKGGMIFADNAFIEEVLTQVSAPPPIVPGGSACNTIIGIGKLQGDARFVGKCGHDASGDLIREDLLQSGVEPMLFTSSSPTGKVLSIVTPDAQRTMFTFLGAASEMVPEETKVDCFENAAIVHIEGYMIYNKELMSRVLSNAKEAQARVSLDLASFTIVEESKEALDEMVADSVDILIANEDEARVFTGHSDEKKALEALAAKAPLAVLKVGKRGSYISYRDTVVQIEPMGSGKAVDTTGAGDLWASGFLYGLVNGYSLEKCGRLGSLCGYEVCQVLGAAIPEAGWQRIQMALDEFPD
jgi:sugar/nucleoside kinase (ribokinase family)